MAGTYFGLGTAQYSQAFDEGAYYTPAAANGLYSFLDTYQEAFKQSKIQQIKQILGWEAKQQQYARLKVFDRKQLATNPKVILASILEKLYKEELIGKYFGTSNRCATMVVAQYLQSSFAKMPFEEGVANSCEVITAFLKAEERAFLSRYPQIDEVGGD